MADAELHIHINNPVDMQQLSDLLNTAIAAKDDGQEKLVVPTGYRCVECYSDDGGHKSTCSIYRVQKRQAERNG
jgi:hypothetical protein